MSHQNSSITKKTSKKGFYAFLLPPLQIAAGVIKDTMHPADISQKRNVVDTQRFLFQDMLQAKMFNEN